MSLLIDDQKFIGIQFHYLETPGPHVSKLEFLKNKEAFEKNKDNPNLNKLETGWKLMTWANHNEIYSQCLTNTTKPDGTIISNLDYIKFRDMKLKFCLKSWDLKDNVGKPAPVNPATIDRLNPQVATELLDSFEKITEVEAQELKN